MSLRVCVCDFIHVYMCVFAREWANAPHKRNVRLDLTLTIVLLSGPLSWCSQCPTNCPVLQGFHCCSLVFFLSCVQFEGDLSSKKLGGELNEWTRKSHSLCRYATRRTASTSPRLDHGGTKICTADARLNIIHRDYIQKIFFMKRRTGGKGRTREQDKQIVPLLFTFCSHYYRAVSSLHPGSS